MDKKFTTIRITRDCKIVLDDLRTYPKEPASSVVARIAENEQARMEALK